MSSTEEPTELISQQPQSNGYQIESTSSASTSCVQKTTVRKPRGIFTTTSSRPTPTSGNREEYLAAGDSGFIQTSTRENDVQTPIPPVQLKQEPIEDDKVAASTSADVEENQNNSKQGNGEVDNIVGNYQVNPLDGSLIKIPVEQTEYIKSYLEYERKPSGRENSSNDPHSVAVDNETFPINSDTGTRRKYRKRKYKDMYDDEDCTSNTLAKHPAGIPKPTGDKAEEVLKAAKSLFSKRTRTLYHWLYPSTSKLELKNIVLSAWDTLQESEKHFYISQVLGRFGFPASNLMVNPQIGGLQGMPTDHLRGNVSGTINLNNMVNMGEEGSTINNTKRVVEELLANETDDDWNISSRTSRITAERKYKRRKYSSRASLNENEGDSVSGTLEEDNSNHFGDDDEFQNDPELSKELATFKMKVNVDVSEETDENQNFENL